MKANKSYVLNTAGKDGEEGGSLYMSRKKGKEKNYFVSKNGIHFGEGAECKLEDSEVSQPFE